MRGTECFTDEFFHVKKIKISTSAHIRAVVAQVFTAGNRVSLQAEKIALAGV